VRQLESDRERGWDSERECIAVLLNVLATRVILCSVVLYLSIYLSVCLSIAREEKGTAQWRGRLGEDRVTSSIFVETPVYILHPSPFIPHPSSLTLHPSPFIPHPSSLTLHPSPFILPGHPRPPSIFALPLSNLPLSLSSCL
jgi:hypothetical protein